VFESEFIDHENSVESTLFVEISIDRQYSDFNVNIEANYPQFKIPSDPFPHFERIEPPWGYLNFNQSSFENKAT
jgi:hypothetical protein